MDFGASIIICTRNRAESLRPTLESISRATVPTGWEIELLVIDNGSRDHTRQVVEEVRLSNIRVRYVLEPQLGQCFARNRGLAESSGRAILFTDDDVRVPANWIEVMCRPIIAGNADAVVGGVVLMPELKKPWMKAFIGLWLASTEGTLGYKQIEVVGANMAFARHVLAAVPAFDCALGPGALGFGDDTLFYRQLRAAGFRIKDLTGRVRVEHHPLAERFRKEYFLSDAKKRGQSLAYIAHHWEHTREDLALVRAKAIHGKLLLRRGATIRSRNMIARPWELAYIKRIAYLEAMSRYRGTTPRYAQPEHRAIAAQQTG